MSLSRPKSPLIIPLTVGVIAVFALALRLVGIGFGLPFHYHWDEPTLLNRVIRMGSGDLNPHYFWYPSLLMYVGLVAEGGLYLAGHLLGAYSSPDAFAAMYFEDSTAVYLLGRILVAAVGAVVVGLTFLVGRRFFSTRVALVGAVLVGVAPIMVASSHFFTTDVPMTFFVLAAYLFLWDVYRTGRRRDYVLSGCLIGLGVATKYLPVLLLASLLFAHFAGVRRRTGRWWSSSELTDLVLGGGLAGAAFFATSPYVFLDWRTALHDYGLLSAQKTAQGCVDCLPSFVPYVTSALPWSVGLVVYVAALAGLVSVAWQPARRRVELGLFWSFPVLLFVVVGSGKQPLARYLVPLAPFLALSAADVFWRAGDAIARSVPGPHVRGAAVSTLALLAVGPAAFVSARYDAYLMQPDPRTAADAWFNTHVPAGTTIAVQPIQDRYFLSAPIMTESQLATLEGYIPAGKSSLRQTINTYYRSRPVYPDVAFVYDLSKLRAEGVRYVVLSSAIYHNVDPAIEDPFYAALAREGTLVARFAPPMDLPDSGLYPAYMPTITIYELPAGT